MSRDDDIWWLHVLGRLGRINHSAFNQQVRHEYHCVADGPGRMAPPPLGGRIKANGAYRHPALGARGVVAFVTRRTALRRRREPAGSFCSTIPRSPSSLASRLRAHSTQRAPWPARHSIWPAGVVCALCASVCPPQFAVRLVLLTRRGRAPRQGPRAAARRPAVPVASSRAACPQRPSAGRPQTDPRIPWRSAVSLASSTSNHVVLAWLSSSIISFNNDGTGVSD